jgi:hypothetical protein
MTTCPRCKSDGADVFLRTVYCPNEECYHFDEEQKKRLEEKAKNAVDGFIRTLREVEESNSLSDPDKTPVWYPDFQLKDLAARDKK